MTIESQFNVKDVVWLINDNDEPVRAVVSDITVSTIDVSGLTDTTEPTMTFIEYGITLYGGRVDKARESELYESEGKALTHLVCKYEELAEHYVERQQQYYLDQANKTRAGGVG